MLGLKLAAQVGQRALGRPPQRESEDRDDECAEGDDRAVVVFDEFTEGRMQQGDGTNREAGRRQGERARVLACPVE